MSSNKNAVLQMTNKTNTTHKDSLEKKWENFCEGIVGQEDVKSEFRPYFESIFYQESLGKPDATTYGSFLLCGPTGTGKGEFARSLARTLHGSSRNILTINCGEFSNSHEVARLLGAPPGYLGHRETVALLSQSRINAVSSDHSNVSVVLWDEIEKAHSDLYKPLLSILDRANVRLGDNNLVNFERTVHIFTSNLGNRYDGDTKAFLVKEKHSEEYKEATQRAAINKFFRKEFLGRMTNQIFFKSFTDKELKELYSLEVDKLFYIPCSTALTKGISIDYIESTPAVVNKILELSNTAEFGARELQHQIKKTLGIRGFKEIHNLISWPTRTGSYALKFEVKSGEIICRSEFLNDNNEN